MVTQLDITASREEELLIEAITDLINYACGNDSELISLENEMRKSIPQLREIHPIYCKKKAEVIRTFLDEVAIHE